MTNAIDLYVSGHIQTSSRQLDAVSLQLPLSKALLLADSKEVDSLAIGLKDTDDTYLALNRINTLVSDLKLSNSLKVKSWEVTAEYYIGVKNLYDRIFIFVLIVLSTITLLAITNTVFMAIHERKQEIGMLRAIGMPKSRLWSLLVLEGFFSGLLGGVIGVALALVLSAINDSFGGVPMPPPPGSTEGYRIRLVIDSTGIMIVLSISIISTLLASLLPAVSSTRRQISVLLAGVLFFISASFERDVAKIISSSAEASEIPVTPQTLDILKTIDDARAPVKGGVVAEVSFEEVGKKENNKTVFKVASERGMNLAVAISEPPGRRMLIVSSGNALWMQKENMHRAMRISPAQRLMGMASNGDVVSTRFLDDYHPISQKKVACSAEMGICILIKLKANEESIKAAYGCIEILASATQKKALEAFYYAPSGKLLKTSSFEYVLGIIHSQLISDSVNLEIKTKVTYGKTVAKKFSATFFNTDKILDSAKSVIRDVPL